MRAKGKKKNHAGKVQGTIEIIKQEIYSDLRYEVNEVFDDTAPCC